VEIPLLGKEIKKIKHLEKEVESLNTNEIEEAFVQSEKQRISLEGLFVEAQSKIEKLGKTLEDRETRLLGVDQELESTRKADSEKDDNIKLVLERCTEPEKRWQHRMMYSSQKKNAAYQDMLGE
jgi:hypothetical protein